MRGDKLPVGLDLIEQLSSMGEVSVDDAVRLADGAQVAWQAIGALLAKGQAMLWLRQSPKANAGGQERTLEIWEVEAIVRNRIGATGESTPPDRELVLRPGRDTDAANRREVWRWLAGG